MFGTLHRKEGRVTNALVSPSPGSLCEKKGSMPTAAARPLDPEDIKKGNVIEKGSYLF